MYQDIFLILRDQKNILIVFMNLGNCIDKIIKLINRCKDDMNNGND